MRRTTGFAAAITTLLAVSTSSAAAGSLTSPASIQVSGTSPWAGDSCGLGGNQTGTNYPNSEVEPWIDVNPGDPDDDPGNPLAVDGPVEPGQNIAGTWQQDRWSNGGARGLVAGVSLDGGATWQQVVIPGVSECSGNPTYQRASDPWLSFAPDGTLYHASLSLDNTGGDYGILVNESYDGGQTWTSPVEVITDDDGVAFTDKESIYADALDSNYVYLTWQINGDTWFSRTTDASGPGQATWEPASVIYRPPGRTISHQIVTLRDGDLVNIFAEFGKGNRKKVALLRSEDKGQTWSGAPITVSSLESVGISDPETSHAVRAGTNMPDLAVDLNSSSPGFGNLYAVWQDSRFDATTSRGKKTSRHDSIAFSVSTDGGFTWSAPIKVNKTPTTIPSRNQQAFTASVDVLEDGTVGVTYYDFRNNTSDSNTLLTDYFAVHCHPASPTTCASGSGWTDETRITDTSFDMSEAPDANGWFVGDYEGLGSWGTALLPFFSQTHSGDPASVFFERL